MQVKMAKVGTAAQGRGGRGAKATRQDLGPASSVDDVKQQVVAMLQQMEKTIESEYNSKFSSAIKSMEERITKTAQAQFDAVTKNIESSNQAMEQVNDYHKAAVADLRAVQRDMERSFESRNEYKASLDSIVSATEDHIGQLRKKYKITT